MSIRFASLSTAALIAVAAASSAFADEAGSYYGAKTVGALVLETRGLATDQAAVARQGGAATAGTVRWVSTPASVELTSAPAGAAYGFGTVGAMVRETSGVATIPAEITRQGGAATASTVRWIDATPRS